MKDCWRNQLSILERGKEDYATDCIIKDENALIKKRIHVGFIRSQIEKYTEPGELVWDPMCGSGSVAIAALLSGRRAEVSDIGKAEVELTNYRLNRLPISKESITVKESDVFDSDVRNADFVFIAPSIMYMSFGYCDFENKEGRAENLKSDDYITWLDKLAKKIKDGVKLGGYVAVYSCDMRENKRLVPCGMLIQKAFSDVLQIIDVCIIDLRNDSRRKRRCIDGQENRRMRHSVMHDYLFIFQKV